MKEPSHETNYVHLATNDQLLSVGCFTASHTSSSFIERARINCVYSIDRHQLNWCKRQQMSYDALSRESGIGLRIRTVPQRRVQLMTLHGR